MAGVREAEEPVKLKSLQPPIPEDDTELAELRKDLERMGCAEFLGFAWGLLDESMVGELIVGRGNQWDNTIRAQPADWNAELWREAYGFKGKCGNGLYKASAKHGKDFLPAKPSAHDGYGVQAVTDERLRRCLAYLVPIFHPEKPGRMQVRLAHTLIGAYTGAREVDWGVLVRETTVRLINAVGKTRGSPLSPYLYHLYRHEECLSNAEQDMYQTALDQAEAGVFDSAGEDDDDFGAPNNEAEEAEEREAEEVEEEAQERSRSRVRIPTLTSRSRGRRGG